MKKEFVPYELALELKDLGFDEECFACYLDDKYLNVEYCKKQFHFHGQVASAPLWQQAFDWFREKYNFNSWISGRKSMGYGYTINNVPNKFKNNILDTLESPNIYESYEKARQACLEKLIELAKEQNVK